MSNIKDFDDMMDFLERIQKKHKPINSITFCKFFPKEMDRTCNRMKLHGLKLNFFIEITLTKAGTLPFLNKG